MRPWLRCINRIRRDRIDWPRTERGPAQQVFIHTGAAKLEGIGTGQHQPRVGQRDRQVLFAGWRAVRGIQRVGTVVGTGDRPVGRLQCRLQIGHQVLNRLIGRGRGSRQQNRSRYLEINFVDPQRQFHIGGDFTVRTDDKGIRFDFIVMSRRQQFERPRGVEINAAIRSPCRQLDRAVQDDTVARVEHARFNRVDASNKIDRQPGLQVSPDSDLLIRGDANGRVTIVGRLGIAQVLTVCIERSLNEPPCEQVTENLGIARGIDLDCAIGVDGHDLACRRDSHAYARGMATAQNFHLLVGTKIAARLERIASDGRRHTTNPDLPIGRESNE